MNGTSSKRAHEHSTTASPAERTMSRSEGLMTCLPLGLSLVRMIVWAARCVDRVRNDDASESRAYPQFFYEAEPRQLLPRTSTRIAVVKVRSKRLFAAAESRAKCRARAETISGALKYRSRVRQTRRYVGWEALQPRLRRLSEGVR